MDKTPDPYEKEIERMGDTIRSNAGFIILFGLGILHLAKKITFDWPAIVVFGIALLPQISRLIDSLKAGKDGVEMKMRAGSKSADEVEKIANPKMTASSTSESQAPAVQPTIAAGQGGEAASRSGQFRDLDFESKKILRTLWRYQQKHFKDDFSMRWTFTVLPNSASYPNYLKGLAPLVERGLVAVPQGQCALTNEGVIMMDNLGDDDIKGDFYVY